MKSDDVAGSLRVPVDLTLPEAPIRVQRFVHDFFTNPVAVLRGEADLGYVENLSPSERDSLAALVRLNLRPLRSATLEAISALRAVEVVSDLEELLEEEDDASRRLEIAGSLARVMDDPGYIRPYLRELKASRDATLKEAHFDDIRLLPPAEQLDFFFDLLADPDSSFVRHLALTELNGLQDRKWYLARELPRNESYYLSRRNDPQLRDALVEAAQSSRSDWEVI